MKQGSVAHHPLQPAVAVDNGHGIEAGTVEQLHQRLAGGQRGDRVLDGLHEVTQRRIGGGQHQILQIDPVAPEPLQSPCARMPRAIIR